MCGTRWVKCGVCGKDVRNKPVLGTMHFCLTDEEVRAKRRYEEQMRWQIAMQNSYIRGGNS